MAATDCIFCRIVRGEIPSKKRYEDDEILAFEDIGPQAPVHLLVIPKRHIGRISEIGPGDEEMAGRLIRIANRLAVETEVAEEGYRLVINCGKNGGQAVDHIHLHLLGGRKLNWPPG